MWSMTKMQRLLASSFIYVVGRALALPYLAIYLTQKYALSQQQLGWVLGSSLMVATVFGLYAGYLSDRLNKSLLLRAACYLMALSSVLLTLGLHYLFSLLCLILIEVAIVTRSIALKSALAELAEVQQRAQVFSINYTLINLAFSIGPLLGAMVFEYHDLAPFWLSAIVGILAALILPPAATHVQQVSQAKPVSLSASWQVLRADKRLLWYSLGSICSAMVFGRFISGYLAQYLLSKGGVSYAATIIPAIFISNALVVVLTQYLIGKHLRRTRLLIWVSAGLSFYILGLLGFMQAESRSAWIIATLIFTLGEVIVIPCEYLFIDSIAPENLRGSYYGVQGLASLGLAINPVLCGYLLAHFPAKFMFYCLMCFAMLALFCFFCGSRLHRIQLRQSGQLALTQVM